MPTDDTHQDTHEPKIDTTTPFKDWNNLRYDLATTPEAADLLDTYGKPAWESLEHDLHRHPYLEERDTFTHAYTYALWHRTLTAARNDHTLPDYTYKELEEITGIPCGRIRDWELDEKTPHLERTLIIHEAARQHWETQLPHEAKDHLLDPSFVYNTLKPLLDHPDHQTPEHLATAIETLYHHNSTQRLTIAKLKPYHKTGPQDLRTIAHTITDYQNQITNLLNHRLNLEATQEELRIAIDHDTLYLWRKTTNFDYWPNAYKGELLYIEPRIKEDLIATVQRHLNANKQELGQLLDQLTDHTRERFYKPRATPYELWAPKYSRYLYGDTLHLFIDTINQSFTIIKPHVTQIARISTLKKGGGIQNPLFPEGKQLNDLRVRLLAIALSDCHIGKSHALTYHENDFKRLIYVRRLFRQLGDCTYQLETLEGDRNRLYISTPVGRLLEYWGVPLGDKHLHTNYRLPEFIRNGTHEAKCAYLAEVIPEDGFFVERNGQMKFGIKRATILDAGPKAEEYVFQPKITQQHKELIKLHGTERTKTIRDDKPRQEITLTKGKLNSLKTEAKNHKDQNLAAQLISIIKDNRCKLLDDEIQLAESLGIKMKLIFKEIRYQESERVSVIWETYTRTEIDTKRWAELALPASGAKRTLVANWFKEQIANTAKSKQSRRWSSKIL